MKSKEELILIGGGGHCKSCIDVIELENRFTIAGIVDLKEKLGQRLLGYPVIATDDDIQKLCAQYRNFLITIGQVTITEMRMNLFATLVRTGGTLPVIVSPLAYVSRYARIGQGTIIMHRAFVNASASIGDNCIINTNAHIEHDVLIGNHCHVATGAILNGDVLVGQGSFIGSGAVTIQGSKIPDFTFIKANSMYKQPPTV